MRHEPLRYSLPLARRHSLPGMPAHKDAQEQPLFRYLRLWPPSQSGSPSKATEDEFERFGTAMGANRMQYQTELATARVKVLEEYFDEAQSQ